MLKHSFTCWGTTCSGHGAGCTRVLGFQRKALEPKKNYGCAEIQLRADYSYNSQPYFGFLCSAIKAVIINY